MFNSKNSCHSYKIVRLLKLIKTSNFCSRRQSRLHTKCSRHKSFIASRLESQFPHDISLYFTLSGIPIAFNAVSCTFVYIVLSSSHNRSLKLLRLFTNARQALQMLFAGKMEKERSSNSLHMFSLLSKKLISLLFDGTLKQRTHLYCTKPTMVHGTF